ncbi:MAG: hypothetical protein GDA45_06265 [Chromatiales bacterium]|nr:hypothetical protein [Chromatiales bacterium]
MTEIALYNLLKRIPDATDDEVEKAVADVTSTKEVATKSDIVELKVETKADLKTGLANLETRLTNRIYAVAGIIVTAAGLMIKFLN